MCVFGEGMLTGLDSQFAKLITSDRMRNFTSDKQSAKDHVDFE